MHYLVLPPNPIAQRLMDVCCQFLITWESTDGVQIEEKEKAKGE
jgi:hypothetical protein